MENRYCVIMAGGVGSRFWPLSKASVPKQFLDILGTGKSLLRQTYERFLPVCPPGNFLVVTSSEYYSLVLDQLPELDSKQVLLEPFRRNTAPCVAFANSFIRAKKDNKASIVVTPADHLIINEADFVNSIKDGLKFAEENDALLTLGIKPNRPETGYGYIQIGQQAGDNYPWFNKVKTFTEKPNLELAKVFYDSGEFLWNSGIFIWALESIDNAFECSLQEIQTLFRTLDPVIGTPGEAQTISKIYTECSNISIDYGIMEKASNVFVRTANFGWSDLGTWSSLHENSAQDLNKNAVISGKTLLYDTCGSIVNIPGDKVAVIQGLNDYIVVDSGDCLLICPRGNEQQIRQFTSDIKTEFGNYPL